MLFTFQKMQGAGNQILVIDRRNAKSISPTAELVSSIRNTTAGDNFDQLMWLDSPQTAEAIASYRVFNNDGSEVEQCGNGVRCVAVLLARQNDGLSEMLLESPAGSIEARDVSAHRASVSMGPPRFNDDLTQISVAAANIDVSIVSMGNPHCVLDVADVKTANVAGLGPAIEQHELFPDRTNVGFMHVVDRATIDLRVFERGAGETLACGTGACAAVASGHRRGLLDDEVAVRLPGGQLVVSWRGGSEAVWLTGDAELISEGTIDL